MFVNKTIIAISTALGKGAIGIIRLSGNNCLNIAKNFIKSNIFNNFSLIETHKLYFANIIDKSNDEIIDEIMFVYMKSPKSYTGEDMIEISCHNNIHILNKILDLAIKFGAILAKPGEFTERAFLNGKMDLSKAEAVLSVIHAESSFAEKVAQRQLRGGLSNIINKFRNEMMDNLKDIEVVLDHEGIMEIDSNKLLEKFKKIQQEILKKVQIGNRTNKIFKGIKIALIGRPNVGKSSILNTIIDQEKAIVSDIAGTTRDLIEASIEHKGIKFDFVDTAGLKNQSEFIKEINESNKFEIAHLDLEKKGIEKTKNCIEIADYIVLILDLSKKIDEMDINLIEELSKTSKNKNILLIGNKKDLKNKHFDINTLTKINKIDFLNENIIEVSAKQNENIEKILDYLVDDLLKENKNLSSDEIFMVNSRHNKVFENIIKNFDSLIEDISIDEPLEIISMDCRNIINLLDEISGLSIDNEEILDKIFSNFCIGK